MILALLLQGAAPAPATPGSAPWAVTSTAGKGSKATSASVWSQDGKARLVVRCDTATAPIVSLQFIPKPGFPAATPRPVSINIDDNGWFGANWQFPGSGAFVSDDAVVTNLSVMLAHAHAIRVRVVTPDNVTVDAAFAGPAGEAPVRAVLAACGYEFGKIPPRSAPRAAPAPAAPAAAADDQ